MTRQEPRRVQRERDGPTQVFGLTRDALWPVVENVASEPVETFDVTIAHAVRGHYGYGAKKLIPTFRYTTKSGRIGSQTVFVKWFEAPGPREAHHYKCLGAIGAPIARMYGSLANAEGGEMVFLEYLAPIDDIEPFDRFCEQAEQFRRFLSVAARFSVGYFPQFWDVARWVGPAIEVGSSDGVCEDVAAFYLSEHRRWGGGEIAVSDFVAQVQVLAVASGLMMLPFAFRRALDGQVDWTDDREEGRRLYRTRLQRILTRLMGA
jgi:hypothetical protein